MNVIPRVGTTWLNENTDLTGQITSADAEEIYLMRGETALSITRPSEFHDDHAFVPANDLEWLAVHAEPGEWYDKSNYIAMSSWRHVRFAFTSVFEGNCYSYQQWKDKRNELFGIDEDKPVKTKVQYVEIDSEEAAYYFTEYDGDVYMKDVDGSYFTVNLQGCIDSINVSEHVIYRKVETPVEDLAVQKKALIDLVNSDELTLDELEKLAKVLVGMKDAS